MNGNSKSNVTIYRYLQYVLICYKLYGEFLLYIRLLWYAFEDKLYNYNRFVKGKKKMIDLNTKEKYKKILFFIYELLRYISKQIIILGHTYTGNF